MHLSVLLEESIKFLNCQKKGIYVDGTVGPGGHSYYLAQSTDRHSQIIAIDRDQEAIKKARQNLTEFKNIIFINDRFENLDQILSRLNIKKIDGVLLDLGFSSCQMQDLKRGFSFQERNGNLETPLDMRMDQSQSFSAFEFINHYSQKKLKQAFSSWGEIKQADDLAHLIVKKRQQNPIQTIGDLLAVAQPALVVFNKRGQLLMRRRNYKKHWATDLFRAIRIEVNQEVEFLEEAIFKIVKLLKPLGRLVIISFHSLEDRIVKNSFKTMEARAEVKILFKKPVTPSVEEIKSNPRARSAKLRVVEKI